MGGFGAAAGAVMSIAAAKQSQRAYQNDAQASYNQAELAGIDADQKAINRTAQLNEQLASISATSAGSGVSVGSGSMINIKRNEKKLAKQDVSSIKFMGNTKQRNYKLQGAGQINKGKAAKLSGYASAAKSGEQAYTGCTGS